MDTVEVTFKETDLSASPEEQHKDHVTVFRGTVNLVHLHPRGDLSGQTGYTIQELKIQYNMNEKTTSLQRRRAHHSGVS